MKIKFYNLGAIKETELDLRPLTIIIGPNNSNKTYIAYSTYGLWKETNDQTVSMQNMRALLTLADLEFDRAEDAILVRVDDRFKQKVLKFGQQVFDTFAGGLEVFYQDTSHQLFSNTRFELSVSQDEVEKALTNLTRKGLRTNEGHYLLSREGDVLVIREDAGPHGPIRLKDLGIQFILVFGLMRELFSRPFL